MLPILLMRVRDLQEQRFLTCRSACVTLPVAALVGVATRHGDAHTPGPHDTRNKSHTDHGLWMDLPKDERYELMEPCPCKSGKNYEECCEPLHLGERVAQSAEELMRSRYAAYAKTQVDYLMETTLPSQRSRHDFDGIQAWSENSTWEGLEIVETEAGGPEDEEGVVEFVALYNENGKERRHHERSNFRKVNDKWYYHNGKTLHNKPVVREHPKVGRNDPCPCGSGRKYKKCCARKEKSA